MKKMAKVCLIIFGLFIAGGCASVQEPLPSWNDTAVKSDILGFVKKVTDEKSPGYVRPEDRIAVFDNDGTLWQEQPTAELVFVQEKLGAAVRDNPKLAERQPYKALFTKDSKYLKNNLGQLLATTYAGNTTEETRKEVRQFLEQSKHPKFNRRYTELTYLPMQELVNYLKDNGFSVYICSGGSEDFIRAFATETYGIPPENVIGTQLEKVFQNNEIKFGNGVSHVNDMSGKPVGIDQRLGKRPVFAGGNVRSNGDIEMLDYTKKAADGFSILIYHDDPEREFSYTDSESLKAAAKNGFKVIDMKNDWKTVFKK